MTIPLPVNPDDILPACSWLAADPFTVPEATPDERDDLIAALASAQVT